MRKTFITIMGIFGVLIFISPLNAFENGKGWNFVNKTDELTGEVIETAIYREQSSNFIENKLEIKVVCNNQSLLIGPQLDFTFSFWGTNVITRYERSSYGNIFIWGSDFRIKINDKVDYEFMKQSETFDNVFEWTMILTTFDGSFSKQKRKFNFYPKNMTVEVIFSGGTKHLIEVGGDNPPIKYLWDQCNKKVSDYLKRVNQK